MFRTSTSDVMVTKVPARIEAHFCTGPVDCENTSINTTVGSKFATFFLIVMQKTVLNSKI